MAHINNLPKFPDFKRLELQDRHQFYQFTKDLPPYSDYNFVSLWSYDVEEDTLISNLNGNLVIRLRDYITNELSYSFFGNFKVIETVEELVGYMEGKGTKPILKLIPEINFEHHQQLIHHHFTVVEDRDNFDYIFSLEKISNLPGSEYAGKRNKIARLLREHPNVEAKLIDLKNEENHKHLLYIFSHWGEYKETEDTAHEFKALKRLLNNSEHLDLLCLGVYLNDKIEAFTITEVLPSNFSLAHFTKADPKIIGIFEFLYKSMAKDLLNRDCLFFNREQDLGLEGLRTAKLSWRPVKFLKKYTISKKLAN
jgi:uncharacterized protein